ncbi:MAG: hypothetical protein GF334_06580 [Candidatus Altiarchaeales archaeon]|nr:hypothetical protein [Candidatus Altiarchaeales archaeon]
MAKKSTSKKKKSTKKENPDQGLLKFEMEELHKYKIMALSSKVDVERNRIRAPILAKKQQEALAETEDALKSDSLFQEASRKQVEAVNELIEASWEVIPEGYAVSKIDPEEGFFEAVYDPERANELLEDE